MAQKIRYSQQVPPFMVYDTPLKITRRIAGNMGFDCVLFGPLTAWWDSMVGKHVFSGIKWVHSSYFSGISVGLPSGKHTKKLWKDPPFLMGRSTINSHVQWLC